jgi:hypothetical protein
MLSQLLHIWGDGGIEDFSFGWGTSTVSNKPDYDAIDLLRELEKHTSTVGKKSGADLLPRLRQQLKSAINDASLTGEAPAFQLLAAYFEALANPLPPEDLALVTALARDDRIERYEGIWKLKSLPRPQQSAIRDALVERALTTSDAAKMAGTAADIFLGALPEGSFASLTPQEELLLQAPERRWALPTLVARLHESGTRRVPLLLTVIREHGSTLRKNREDTEARRIRPYERGKENEGHRSTIDAARTALCRLGPAASPAVRPLRQMMADGTIPRNLLSGHEGASWGFALARMGFPVEQLTKPDSLSGSDEQHRKQIRGELRSNDPTRYC